MVRLIAVKGGWAEDAPAQCPDGHRKLVPTWTACAECGGMCRHWECRTEGCTAPAQMDDEHVHNG